MPERIPDDAAVIAFCDKNLSNIGFTALGIAALLIVGMSMAGYRMGYKLFYSSIGIGNAIILLAGAALVALGIYAHVALKLGLYIFFCGFSNISRCTQVRFSQG